MLEWSWEGKIQPFADFGRSVLLGMMWPHLRSSDRDVSQKGCEKEPALLLSVFSPKHIEED